MAVLLDTNILLRSAQRHHPLYSIARAAMASLLRDGESLHVTVQNLVEFWAVATRAEKDNGLGISLEHARREIAVVKRLFGVLPESDRILPEWERLVSEYRVSGKNAHDARLVASRNVNGLGKVLTFNTPDFLRFHEIQVLDPRLVR